MEEEKIAKITSEQQENDRIMEEKHRARLETVERAVELIKKSNDERFYELKRGLILSEVQLIPEYNFIAQNKLK